MTYTITIPLEMIFTIGTILSFVFGVFIGAVFLYRVENPVPPEVEADEWPNV